MTVSLIETLTLLCLPLALLLDLVYQAQTYPAQRFWRLKALVVSALSFFLSLKFGELWGSLLPPGALLDTAPLGALGGAGLGVLVYELAHYGYHRLAHSWTPLWRLHQFHHAPESLDAFGAFWIHPLDLFFFTSWSVLVFVPLLGLSAEAGALAAAVLTFNAVFQHSNVKTPRWLGYLVQRPESHSLHHARDVHARNYSDLPLIDMLFGTFENPPEFVPEVGFAPGSSNRLGALCLGLDLSRDEGEAEPQTAGELPVAGRRRTSRRLSSRRTRTTRRLLRVDP